MDRPIWIVKNIKEKYKQNKRAFKLISEYRRPYSYRQLSLLSEVGASVLLIYAAGGGIICMIVHLIEADDHPFRTIFRRSFTALRAFGFYGAVERAMSALRGGKIDHLNSFVSGAVVGAMAASGTGPLITSLASLWLGSSAAFSYAPPPRPRPKPEHDSDSAAAAIFLFFLFIAASRST